MKPSKTTQSLPECVLVLIEKVRRKVAMVVNVAPVYGTAVEEFGKKTDFLEPHLTGSQFQTVRV